MAIKLTIEFVCSENRAKEIEEEVARFIPEFHRTTKENTKTLDELLYEMETKLGKWTRE